MKSLLFLLVIMSASMQVGLSYASAADRTWVLSTDVPLDIARARVLGIVEEMGGYDDGWLTAVVPYARLFTNGNIVILTAVPQGDVDPYDGSRASRLVAICHAATEAAAQQLCDTIAERYHRIPA